jgi:hypothetical protein
VAEAVAIAVDSLIEALEGGTDGEEYMTQAQWETARCEEDARLVAEMAAGLRCQPNGERWSVALCVEEAIDLLRESREQVARAHREEGLK